MGEYSQHTLFKAMADPAFYPHDVDALSERDTHISKVFLTGAYVYKIKKMVDLGFVNFQTLEKRRFFCEQEVSLNRRLTEDVYLDVIPLCYDGRRFSINGSGDPVEYAVRMRQLQSRRTMGQLLKTDRMPPQDVKRLADRLVAFHQSASRTFDPVVRSNAQEACMENFRQLKPHVGRLLDAGHFDSVRTATFNFFSRNRRFFEKRLADGRFRDNHGDLRTEHVYVMEDGRIQILDCIEFNERLRLVDTASDLAFLLMDLEYHRHPATARFLVETYGRQTDDISMLCLMDFYKCYRAMVRCKVNCLTLKAEGLDSERSDKLAEGARRYLCLAHHYARRYDRPTLWVFCGFPATGKSALAVNLAEILAVKHYNSDRIRKRMHGLDPLAHVSGPASRGLYAPEVGFKVYDRLLELARKAIREGSSVILDATYSASAQREKLRRMVHNCGARMHFVECRAPDEILRRRLKQRETVPSVSDARLAQFEMLKSRFEPLTEIEPTEHIALNTAQSREACLRDLFKAAYLDKLGNDIGSLC